MEKYWLKNLVILSIFLTATATAYALPRDAAQTHAFRRDHPCPSTGKVKGACPGYQIDHVMALMNGGEDRPDNMQWLSVERHKAKTRKDRALCKKSYRCKSARWRKK